MRKARVISLVYTHTHTWCQLNLNFKQKVMAKILTSVPL